MPTPLGPARHSRATTTWRRLGVPAAVLTLAAAGTWGGLHLVDAEWPKPQEVRSVAAGDDALRSAHATQEARAVLLDSLVEARVTLEVAVAVVPEGDPAVTQLREVIAEAETISGAEQASAPGSSPQAIAVPTGEAGSDGAAGEAGSDGAAVPGPTAGATAPDPAPAPSTEVPVTPSTDATPSTAPAPLPAYVAASEIEAVGAALVEATAAAEALLVATADGELSEALDAARTRLAAWEPLASDPARLDALRTAVAAAEELAPAAPPADRLEAAAGLRAETALLPEIVTDGGVTTIDGVLVANKTIGLPEDYRPGLLPEVTAAFARMQSAAADEGLHLFIKSGFRSYGDQRVIYGENADRWGTDYADRFSSRPGHSEHQTGLAIDVNMTHPDFAGTPQARWLAAHAAEYGFVVRYPEGKEEVTGYRYEPWHLRYLGVELAQELTASGLTLEEHLGITSSY